MSIKEYIQLQENCLKALSKGSIEYQVLSSCHSVKDIMDIDFEEESDK